MKSANLGQTFMKKITVKHGPPPSIRPADLPPVVLPALLHRLDGFIALELLKEGAVKPEEYVSELKKALENKNLKNQMISIKRIGA